MRSRVGMRLLFMAAVMLSASGPAAWAENLADALSGAYLGNPTLRAARAGQRATDELVPQALSGWRPTVTVDGVLRDTESSVTARTTVLDDNNEPQTKLATTKSSSQSGDVTIALQQPLFRGFGTVAGTKAAEAQVRAGRQNLLATEQEVLFSAVQAYMDVYSGRQLVRLEEENVKVLQGELNNANARFAVGEITRTDVAQARASLSAARGTLADIRAQLAADSATYLEVVGKEPGKLTYPKLSKLPPSLKSALAAAAEINPSILAAAFVEDASLHRIGVAKAPLFGEADLVAQGTLSDEFGHKRGNAESFTVAGTVSIPLYEAGAVYSQVREAKQLASQQRIRVIEVERAVRQAVTASWNFLVASRQVIASAKDQVAAAQLAFEGVQQEYDAGTRTTQDVLDALADVVRARARLVVAEKNQIVAAYQLVGSIGRLTARDLSLKVPYYDPEANYRAVRNKWIGTGAETVE